MPSLAPLDLGAVRKLHLIVGLAGVAVFLGTGVYMRTHFPALYAGNEALRYMYRANHVYLLTALAGVAAQLPSAGRATRP